MKANDTSIRRSAFSAGRASSESMKPIDKAAVMTFRAERSLLELIEETRIAIVDMSRYLSQFKKSDVGGDEWKQLMRALWTWEEYLSALIRQKTSLSNLCEDLKASEAPEILSNSAEEFDRIANRPKPY